MCVQNFLGRDCASDFAHRTKTNLERRMLAFLLGAVKVCMFQSYLHLIPYGCWRGPHIYRIFRSKGPWKCQKIHFSGSYNTCKASQAAIPQKKIQSSQSKTGNFAMWKFLVSQTDNKWWLVHFFDSCDYLSRPSDDPEDHWWWHFDDPEVQSWWHFDEPDDFWWRHFDDHLGPSDYLVTTHMTSITSDVMTLMT